MNSSTLEHFWANIDRRGPDECWEWTSRKMSNGYGAFWLDHRNISAHRLIWELHHGPIPKGMQICHHCDNPGCCNPKHLFMGTRKDNTADMIRKGRHSYSRTWVTHVLGPELSSEELKARANRRKLCKLTCEQVEEIRRSYHGKRGEQSKLAKQYGVTGRAIGHIVNGTRWAWLRETS